MADNASIIVDEDGDYSDWIEIYNPFLQPVNLQGWSLTDDPDSLQKWIFPPLELAPRAYHIVYASGKNRGKQVYWETVIEEGDIWRYRIGNAAAPVDWADMIFDDTSWLEGATGIGYDDGDDTTVIEPTISIFTRKTFTVENSHSVLRAVLHIDYDDGFVAYLNGSEVARANLGQTGVRPAYNQGAHSPREALMYDGGAPEAYELGNLETLLQPGENVLAIEVHNVSAGSSDLSFIPFLTLGFEQPLSDPQGVDEAIGSMPTPSMHTNFKLSKEGEFLALVGPDGQSLSSVFDPAYPGQEEDVSYGIAGSSYHYLLSPTPGTVNSDILEGYIENVSFSVERGIHNLPYYLTLSSSTPYVKIKYTTDGTTPSETRGTRYTEPLYIAETSVIRAVAYRNGFVPPPVETHTYIFLQDVVAQSPGGEVPPGWPHTWGNNDFDYGMDPSIVGVPGSLVYDAVIEALIDIPSISLVTDASNLFDPSIGIYANAYRRGRDWERPVSLELINPDGTEGFFINAGLRIRGGYSRSSENPKHAFRLFFRTEYGKGKLRYPLFGNEGVDFFDNIDLRTSQNYSWSFDGSERNTFIWDVFSRDMQRDMGVPYTRSRYYHLYLNGQYWGLYQSQERPEASFGASYFGGNSEDYDVIKSAGDVVGPYDMELTDGTLDAWSAFWNRVNELTDTADPYPIYQELQGLNPDGTRNPAYPVMLDVDNLINYMLIIFYTGNWDAPIISWMEGINNFYTLRNRYGNHGFMSFAHDSEHGLISTGADRTGPFAAGRSFSESNPQWIHQQLMAVEEYRVRFGDLVHRHLFNGGALTEIANKNRFLARAEEIEKAIIAESARWGDAQRSIPFTRNDWLVAVQQPIDDFFPVRKQILINQLQADSRHTDWRLGNQSPQVPAPLYPSVSAPVFSRHGGVFTGPYDLVIDQSVGAAVYYTLDGTDPRSVGGAIAAGAKRYDGLPVRLDRRLTVKARAYDDGSWSALNEAEFLVDVVLPVSSNVVISEINYRPYDPSEAERAAGYVDAESFEFIELYNPGTEVVDLSGLSFTEGIVYTFTGTVLGPGERLLLVSDVSAFEFRYGHRDGVVGQYRGFLSDAGEQLILRQSLGGSILHRMRYSAGLPWPLRASGSGSTLELVDVEGISHSVDNWRASVEYGGTPGRAGVGVDGRVRINEVLSRSEAVSDLGIELYNTTGEAIDVGGWMLTDSLGGSGYWLPSGTVVSAGGYAVLDSGVFGEGGLGIDGGRGGTLWLVEADSSGVLRRFVDVVSFGGTLPGVSSGRYEAGQMYPMRMPTLGLANSGFRVGEVLMREVMSYPFEGRSDLSYVVLYNAGMEVEDIGGWRLSGSVEYDIPEGMTLQPGDSLVVTGFAMSSPTEDLMRSVYAWGELVPISGGWRGEMDRGGGRLVLYRRDSESEVLLGYAPLMVEDVMDYGGVSGMPEEAKWGGWAYRRGGGGLWGLDVDSWILVERQGREEQLPIGEGAYALSYAYPNPTSGGVTLSLRLRERQQVSVRVYDVLGRQVCNVWDGEIAGDDVIQLELDAGRLPSGLYWFWIVGEHIQASRAFTVVR